jgi:hypothetical protein
MLLSAQSPLATVADGKGGSRRGLRTSMVSRRRRMLGWEMLLRISRSWRMPSWTRLSTSSRSIAEHLGERALPHQPLQLVLPHQLPIRPRLPLRALLLLLLLLLHSRYRVRRGSRRHSRRIFSGKPRFRLVRATVSVVWIRPGPAWWWPRQLRIFEVVSLSSSYRGWTHTSVKGTDRSSRYLCT